MSDTSAQSRVLFLFPDSSEIRYTRKPKPGDRVRSAKGDIRTVAEVLKSGIDTYTVTCVAPPKGARDVAADLLGLVRKSISAPPLAVPDSRADQVTDLRVRPEYGQTRQVPIAQRVTDGPDWVIPPDVPIASSAFIDYQDTSGTHSDDGADRREHEKNTPIADALASRQLSALARVSDLFGKEGIAYWLFGGWAVDFYAGSVTRAHDDVDVAVWLEDVPRIAKVLEEDGWRHAPLDDEDGGTGYERGSVRLELTYLVRDADGGIFTPLRQGRGKWSTEALANDVGELRGVRSRLVEFTSLMRRKSSPRDDPEEAAKDSADFEQLSRLGTGTLNAKR